MKDTWMIVNIYPINNSAKLARSSSEKKKSYKDLFLDQTEVNMSKLVNFIISENQQDLMISCGISVVPYISINGEP